MKHAHEAAWDALARLRPLESISTESRGDRRRFWESGERTAGFLRELLSPASGAKGSVLDFGVGIGRTALPLARHFSHVIGVDVSREMLDAFGREACRAGFSNVSSFHLDEAWDRDPVDFAYSILTFQHMPDEEVLAVLPRLRRATRGIAYFQFDTRPSGWSAAFRLVPEPLLPWFWKPGMRRETRRAADVRAWLKAAGFGVLREIRPDSPLHGFLVEPVTAWEASDEKTP